MDYAPKPLCVAGVALSADLLALTERLAENTHEIWAAQRLKDGWTYGPQRDDAKKLHPCLVPYADLPESEKEYDRNTALGTLKAIMKLDFSITAPPATRPLPTPRKTNAPDSSAIVRVQVCGDLLLDFGMQRHSDAPVPVHSDGIERVRLEPTPGGAWYLASVLRHAFDEDDLSVFAAPEASTESPPPSSELTRVFQTWARFREVADDKAPSVWRLEELMGCMPSKTPFAPNFDMGVVPQILVIDDLGLGFANQPAAWPSCLQHAAGTSSPNQATRLPDHIVLKASSGIGHSALWRHLANQPQLATRLTVVVPIRVLRQRGAQILPGLSWDRAMDDLDNELVNGLSAQDLGHACRVIVGYLEEGVAVYQQKEDRTGLTFDRFMFDSCAQEGSWRSTRPGRTFGGLSFLTAAVVRHLARPADYPLNFALARALAASRLNHHSGGSAAFKLVQEKGFLNIVPSVPDPEQAYDLRKHFAGQAVCEVASELLTKPQPDANDEPRKDDPVDAFVFVRRATSEDAQFGFLSRGSFPDAQLDCRRIDLLRDATGSTDAARLATAIDIVLRGPTEALRNAPKAQYKDYFTADRDEVERINTIRNLILSYLAGSENRPLSIAVFGSPGCGKSFAVKQLMASIFPKPEQRDPLVFNLAEFPADPTAAEAALAAALHQVRNVTLRGSIPLVFWDEFDADGLRWLKNFLAPMQDAEFREGSVLHPLGRAIFVFAGGTCRGFAEFNQQATVRKYAGRKVTDFLSRLRGFIDIKGPNRPPNALPCEDPAYVIRRALLLRYEISKRYPQAAEKGCIATDIITALLQAGEFVHGARSIEAIVAMGRGEPGSAYTAATLPSPDQLALHLNPNDVRTLRERIASAPLCADLIEQVASARHAAWMNERLHPSLPGQPEWVHGPVFNRNSSPPTDPRLIPHGQLARDDKEANRGPARLLADYLERHGYIVCRQSPSGPSPEAVSDFASEAEALVDHEHQIWMQTKWLRGWDPPPAAAGRQNHLRYHPDLIPTKELQPAELALDQAIIQALPKALAENGWEILRNPKEIGAPSPIPTK